MINTGKGFVNTSASAGAAFANPLVGRGAAFGDLNNDGQIDVAIASLDGTPVILRNDGAKKNHWVGLSLVGSKSNRNGIGARITVTDGAGRKQIFDANTSGSYLSSNDPRIIAGLGAAEAVRQVEVKWPSGVVQRIAGPQIDRYLVINETSPP
jgi:hypothetical protein